MNISHPSRRSLQKLSILACLLLSVVAIATPLPTDAPSIAIFGEPGFFNFLGWQSLKPQKMAALLKEAGFKAEVLDVAALSDPANLSTSKYAAVVLAYGNAFPIDAFPALKSYHQSGGVMVLSGIPFCHPTVKTNGVWKSRGGELFFGHDDKGIGTGGFIDPKFSGPMQVATPGYVSNPLGLSGEDLPDTASHRFQCLNPKSLPPEDEVLPLIELVEPSTNKTLPAAVIIKHGCARFHGAIDIWTGVVASELEETHKFLASQLMLRGLAVAFQMKGIITPAHASKVLAFAGALRRPSSLPGDLAYLDKVAEIYNARDDDMVFVTPSQLTELYLQSLMKQMSPREGRTAKKQR